MKKFAYKNAENITDAASLLKTGSAAILAGGTDILNLLKIEALNISPELLVNIKNIPGLDTISENASGLEIGASTRISSIASSEIIKSGYPMLANAAESVASPALREMGTIAGNLFQEVQCWYFRRSILTGNTFDCLRKGGRQCYAVNGDNRYHAILGAKGCYAICPSDIAVALTALNASIITSKRSIHIDDVYKVMGNNLDDDEIVTRIQVPAQTSGTRQVFIKFTFRPAIDFAIVSVGAVIDIDEGKVSDARIVLGAVAPTPYRATSAGEAIIGKTIDESIAETAGMAAVKDAKPLSHNRYKIQISKTLVKRAILACNS
jgi:xanthine dehydrogenase YagS FAD-binding subunit